MVAADVDAGYLELEPARYSNFARPSTWLAHTLLTAGFQAALSGSEILAAAGCVAECNGSAGFIAEHRGLIRLGPDAVAARNEGSGFVSHVLGSVIEVGGGARSEGNDAGFIALDGGEVAAEAGCVAVGNRHSGFAAQGLGARTQAGPRCRAERNGMRRVTQSHALARLHLVLGVCALAVCLDWCVNPIGRRTALEL